VARENSQLAELETSDRRGGSQYGRLLALDRAGGDEHRTIGGDAKITKDTADAAAGRRWRVECIELQVAGDNHARRIRPDVDNPPRRFVALHREPIDVVEHAPEQDRKSTRLNSSHVKI